MKSKVNKSEMKKENSAHSFTEGYQLSEEEKKPFLTEQDLKTFVLKAYSNDGYRRACTLGYRTAAEKANAKIAELEKRYNDLSGALRFKYGEWENLKAENEQLEKRLAELEKERDEFAIEFATWAMDHAKWSDYVLHNGMVTLLERFKQQKK